MTHHSPLEKRLLWAAFTLAFYGCLQANEFATPNLIWQHIHFGGDSYTVFIKQSKTDPFHCGNTITIHVTSTSTYPVRAFRLYAEATRSSQDNAPVFKGTQFSRQAAFDNYYPPLTAEHSIQPSTLFQSQL